MNLTLRNRNIQWIGKKKLLFETKNFEEMIIYKEEEKWKEKSRDKTNAEIIIIIERGKVIEN
jgi:hypothetical protein